MTELDALRAENALLREQLGGVVEIGIALSAQHDLKSLLATILSKARWLACADAGSLYLVEGDRRDRLRFVLAQNDSCAVPFAETVLDIDSRTIAGHVARTRSALNLADVYTLPAEAGYSYSPEFDRQVGYRCKSMLVVPMIDRRDRVAGCIQLINCKPDRDLRLCSPDDAERWVRPFPEPLVPLLQSIASQSAVAIDKARLIDDLERTFDGLVHAAVVAIEARDPATSGHSVRVAELSTAIADAINERPPPSLRELRFSPAQIKELRYAGLLHDFGKVGVREQVLVKSRKLYPWELAAVQLRFAAAMSQRAADAAQLRRLLDAVNAASEPRPLSATAAAALDELQRETYLAVDGSVQPLLTPSELADLRIERGSLNVEQRREIESHVVHSYRFLSRIPWTEELRELPRIAGAHHERLDGSGYPNGLRAPDILPQSRIMAVADIFDALTAIDRPYKKAMAVDRALDVLDQEVRDGHVDGDIVALLRERQLYRSVLPERT
ncbi:MAG: HD domain-containing phosphohydrolase [Sinimarinibacterium sp.]|jgi:HD-GYP domain-containing protein (c-di-GMP phosphodiesterase class II)